MILVVSPYHVTTREAPVMAALLLGERVVTMTPAPLTGSRRERAEAAATRVPPYLSLLRSWEWTVPLWEAGVLSSSFEGHDPVADVRLACRRIDLDGRYAALRPLMRPGLFDTDDGYLDSVSRDLLKGGPDPAICVPVSAAMDRFALTHGLAPVRSEAVSVAQKSEEKLGGRAFTVVLPVLVQGGAGHLLAARRVLSDELAGLVRAIDAERGAPEISTGGHARPRVNAASKPAPSATLAHAARHYAQAFEGNWDGIARAGTVGDDETRAVAGMVAITGLRLPYDAVLASSVSAFEAAAGRSLNGSHATPPAAALAERDALEGRTFVSLVVRVLGARR